MTPKVSSRWQRAAYRSFACLKTRMAFRRNTYNFSSEKTFHLRSFGSLKFLFLNLTMKKYEIYLPLKYNDGKKIESEKLKEIRQQLMAVFEGITISSMSSPYEGTWRSAGVEFNDNIIRIEIITTEDEDLDSLRFFKNFKRQLKRTLRQLDILITVQDIYRI